MVRCADCGYLAMRIPQTRKILEMEMAFRETGRFPEKFGSLPVCFVGEIEFPTTPWIEMAKEERICEQFCQHISGISPEGHRDMQFGLELSKLDERRRKDDQDREDRRRKEDLAWQEKVRKEDREWKAEQERKAEMRWDKEHGLQKWQLLIVGILGTLVIAAATIIGAMIQAGFFKKN